CTVCRITPPAKAEQGIQFEILRRHKSSMHAATPTTPAITAKAVTGCPLFQNSYSAPRTCPLGLVTRCLHSFRNVPPGTATAREIPPAAQIPPVPYQKATARYPCPTTPPASEASASAGSVCEASLTSCRHCG